MFEKIGARTTWHEWSYIPYRCKGIRGVVADSYFVWGFVLNHTLSFTNA